MSLKQLVNIADGQEAKRVTFVRIACLLATQEIAPDVLGYLQI